MKLKKYLIESKIAGSERKKLIEIFKSKQKKATFYFKNFGPMDIRSSKGVTIFTYDTAEYNLTMELINLVDSLDEFEFETKIKGNEIKFRVIPV